MKRSRLSKAALGGLLGASMFVTPVFAADLGGDCCADLEERVAELEATTARKGNRKVSLAITGWVAEQVMWYDNGATSNTYVTGVGSTLSSHFKLTGAATISPEWSAGYVLQLEVNSSDPLTAGNSRFGDDGPSALRIVNSNGGLTSGSVDLLYSFWFLKSSRLGQVSVGLIPQASQHAAALVDGSGSLVMANWVPLDGMAINLSQNGTQLVLPNGTGFPTGALMWCGSTALPVAGDCDGIPTNAVRYDSPTFGGFSVSASWGEDDFWDVAARYAGEFNGIKLAVTAAYSHHSDESQFMGFDTVTGLTAFHPVHLDSDYFQAGAFIHHVSSGLFLYGAYGVEDNNSVYAIPAITAGQPSGSNWYLKAGLRRKWSPLGHTVLYGEYGVRDDMYHPALTGFGVTGSELRQWGLGVVQEIDAAAMTLWLNYKNYDPSMSGPGVAGVFDDLDDLHVVTMGGLISF
ncbi:MAG: porin [Hyphomicrobiaceae bacterium]|nr:porin [Hyphomicrobiaceae bacterium]